MDFERMKHLQEDVFDQIRKIRETKGREYATDEDTLSDFKEVAVEAGVTPLQVWATYVKKHERAIDTFIREGAVKSESIEGRILDVIVYHFLLYGLIEDLAVTDPTPGVREAPFSELVTVVPNQGDAPHGDASPLDVMRRWAGAQINSQTLVAINAELRALGFDGTATLKDRTLTYMEPPQGDDPDERRLGGERTPDGEGVTLPKSATAVWEDARSADA